MTQQLIKAFVTMSIFAFASQASADVVLTFSQSGAANGIVMDQAYGDRVMESPDGNNHLYDIIPGMSFGLTSNVEVSYAGGSSGGDATNWTSGFGDLDTVLNNEFDGDDALSITFTADPGFEVGIFGFDMAGFSIDQTFPGVSIQDGSNTTLWSMGSTVLSGTTHNDFDFAAGLFASQLTIAIDLSGLGDNSDNIGIDNVHFVQRTAIPEPTAGFLLTLSTVAYCLRRKRA